MMRFGTALGPAGQCAVAQRGGEADYIDIAAVAPCSTTLRSLDDLLDLPDAELAACIEEVRDAPADLPAGIVTLRTPLSRPARLRDCGMVTSHLRPAFEQIFARLEAQGSSEVERVRAVVEPLLASAGARLRWADRDVATISGPGETIFNPGGELDFELELAAIIRRSEQGIPEIFGYTLYNDWTLRDLQIDTFVRTGRLHGGAKDFAASNTVGPMVVLASDIANPLHYPLRAEVNDEIVAEGTMADATWTFPDVLPELFRDDPIRGHEIAGTGTMLGGCLFEQGLRLPHNATVRLLFEPAGALMNHTEWPR